MITLTPSEKALNRLFDCAKAGATLWSSGKQEAATVRFQKSIAGIQAFRYVGYTKDECLSLIEHDLAQVAQIQTECGALGNAIELLKRLTLPSSRFQVILVLAPALVHANRSDIAEQLVSGHGVSSQQAYLKTNLAIAYAKMGCKRDAMRHVVQITNRLEGLKKPETSVRCQLSVALGYCGYLDEALSLSAKLMDALWRYSAQFDLMQLLVEAQRTEEGLAIARKAIEKTMRSGGLHRVENEHFGGVAMMVELSRGLMKHNQREAALAVLVEARSWANRIHPDNQSMILVVIASGFLDANDSIAATEALNAASQKLKSKYLTDEICTTRKLIKQLRAGRSTGYLPRSTLGGPLRWMAVRVL